MYPLRFSAAVQVSAKVGASFAVSKKKSLKTLLAVSHMYQVYNSIFDPNAHCFRLVSVAPVQLAGRGGCHLHGAFSGFTP